MRFSKTKALIAVVFSLCVFLASALVSNADRSKEPTRYIFSIDSYGIHRLDTISDSEETIFNTEGMYGVSFSVSPSETMIALLITKRGFTPPGAHDYSVLPKNSMVFTDTDGKEITRLDENVRKFSWSPDGDAIAYITGTYREDGDIGFTTTGVFVFDLTDGSKRQIKKDFPHSPVRGYKGGGYDINWAVHDTNIYVKEFGGSLGGNYSYNTKTGRTEKVPYSGIHFSPDGKYYLALSSMEYPRLYVSSNNLEITEQAKSRLSYLPQSWMAKQEHHLVAVKVEYESSPIDMNRSEKVRAMVDERKVKQRTFSIYDVESDQVIEEWVEKPEE